MEFFEKAFQWIADVSQELPTVSFRLFFIIVLAVILLVGIIIAFSMLGSRAHKLYVSSKKIRKYLAKVETIDDDNVSDFTAHCFAKKTPQPLRDAWVQYLGVRFGYPSDIVSDSAVYDKFVKKNKNVRAGVFLAISVILLAVFVFWGYGTLDAPKIGVVHLAALLLVGVVYLVLVLMGRKQNKRCAETFDAMQEDLDAKVNLQIESNYATDSSPLSELNSLVEEIIARNTAKVVDVDEDEQTPIEALIEQKTQEQQEESDEQESIDELLNAQEEEQEEQPEQEQEEEVFEEDVEQSDDAVEEESAQEDEQEQQEQSAVDTQEESAQEESEEADEEATEEVAQDTEEESQEEPQEEVQEEVQEEEQVEEPQEEQVESEEESAPEQEESEEITEAEEEESEDTQNAEETEEESNDESEEETEEETESEEESEEESESEEETDDEEEKVVYVVDGEEDDDEQVKPAKLVKLPNLVDYMLSKNMSKAMKIQIATMLISTYNKFKDSKEDRKIVVSCLTKVMNDLQK